jgi:hypothetical protein
VCQRHAACLTVTQRRPCRPTGTQAMRASPPRRCPRSGMRNTQLRLRSASMLRRSCSLPSSVSSSIRQASWLATGPHQPRSHQSCSTSLTTSLTNPANPTRQPLLRQAYQHCYRRTVSPWHQAAPWCLPAAHHSSCCRAQCSMARRLAASLRALQVRTQPSTRA